MAFNMLNLISFCSKSGMDEGGSWGLESFQAEPCLLGSWGLVLVLELLWVWVRKVSPGKEGRLHLLAGNSAGKERKYSFKESCVFMVCKVKVTLGASEMTQRVA
jgi:hypothetical protein